MTLRQLSEAELAAFRLRDMAAELIKQAVILEETYAVKLDPNRVVEFIYDTKKKKKPQKS